MARGAMHRMIEIGAEGDQNHRRNLTDHRFGCPPCYTFPMVAWEPRPDCAKCPRLARFRRDNQAAYLDFHNAPVAAFGSLDAPLLIVGLAPGLKGANRTGRPFTGDFAGDLLYGTLLEFGLARGNYDRRADDGFYLCGCRVTNAIRCVPPANKPTPDEAKNCRPYLTAEIGAMPSLKGIIGLGQIAHTAVVAAYALRQKDLPFGHGRIHDLGDGRFLADSYHCSRYNTNTGRLTPKMFREVVAAAMARARIAG